MFTNCRCRPCFSSRIVFCIISHIRFPATVAPQTGLRASYSALHASPAPALGMLKAQSRVDGMIWTPVFKSSANPPCSWSAHSSGSMYSPRTPVPGLGLPVSFPYPALHSLPSPLPNSVLALEPRFLTPVLRTLSASPLPVAPWSGVGLTQL